MQGYVTPLKSELKLREFEIYNAYYCGICRSIKDRYGELPRLLLTYDSVFLAILLTSVSDEKDPLYQGRCMTNPFKKKNFLESGKEIDYATDMLLVLAYLSLLDDYKDEKKLLAKIGSAYLKKIFKEISAIYPQKVSIITEKIDELSDLEKKHSNSLDKLADKFALIMEEVMDYNGLDKETSSIFRKLGYHLGMWIYILDAYDDMEKDKKTKSFNPLLQREGKSDIKSSIKLSLTLHLSEMSKQLDKLNIKKNKGIIENIIYLGLLQRTEQVIEEDTNEQPI